MDLIDSHLSLGLVATALLTLRILITPLLLYNASWSFKGFLQLLKGDAFPTSIYQTTVFMFSGAVLGYNVLTFLGRNVSTWSLPWSLTFQCMILTASIAVFIGRRVAVTVDFERFYWLFNSGNLDIATRVAEMNEADPEYTEGVVSTAETTLALKLAKRAIENNAD